MSLRKKQKAFVRTRFSFTDRGDIMDFIKLLIELKLDFHYDDPVSEVFAGQFKPEELESFAGNMNRMRDTADRLCVDVFDYALRVSNRNDPDSEYFECKTERFETDTVHMKNLYSALISEMFKAYDVAEAETDADFNRDIALEILQKYNCGPGNMYEVLAFEEAVLEVLGEEQTGY